MQEGKPYCFKENVRIKQHNNLLMDKNQEGWWIGILKILRF